MFLKKTTRYLFLFIFSLVISTSVFAQSDTLKVNGIVTDASTGMPVEGASISVKGYSSTMSGVDGSFVLRIPNTQSILSINALNYQYKEVAVKGQTNLIVKIWESGYNSVYNSVNTILAEKSTTNVSNASNTVSSAIATTNESVEQLIQGKVPGLNSILHSGTPGVGGSLFIRGYNTFFADAQPLIVVDGNIMGRVNTESMLQGNFINPLSTIDPKDIERVTVIKDAVSIYGAQAANGVILIETARGTDMKTSIDFYAHSSFNMFPKQLPMMNAFDYRAYALDQFSDRGYSSSRIAALPMMIDDPAYSYYHRFHNNTNWQDEVIENSMNQNYYMRVKGGDPIAKYSLSVGSSGNSGIVKGTKSTSYFTQFNADVRTTKKLTLNTSFRFNYRNSYLYDDGNSRKYSPIYAALIKSPLMTTNLYDPSGLLTPNLEPADEYGFSNPAALVDFDPDNYKQYKLLASANFEYKFNEKFKLSTLIGIDYDKARENVAIAGDYIEPDTSRNNELLYRPIRHATSRLLSLYNDSRFVYNQMFDYKHNVSFVAGYRYKTSSYESDFGKSFNSANDRFVDLQNGQNEFRQIGGHLGEWKSLAFYSSIDYAFRNKYILTFAGSVESSSRFGDEIEGLTMFSHKFGFFPSVSGAWLISSENFMSGLKNLELLKLRASYGITGNDDIGNYNSQTYYVPIKFMNVMGMVLGSVPNPKMKWETTSKLNLGIDLSLFNERLNFTADVYKHVSDDIIFPFRYDFIGSEAYLANGASMENQGIEISANGRILKGNLKWDAGIVFAKNINKITKLPYGNDYSVSYFGGNMLLREGEPFGMFYGYKTKGVFTSNLEAEQANLSTMVDNVLTPFRGGDMIFDDYYTDNIIDEKDMQVIGNPNPDFTGSISNSFAYKRLSLDVLLTFSYGNDVFNYRRSLLESMAGMENQTEAVLKRWRTDGQVTNMPRASYGDPKGNARFSDRWIEDGSYVRIKTITLSYDVPVKVGFFRNASVYVSANNLFTFDKYLGYDPEFSATESPIGQGIDTGLTPQFRTFFLGLKVGL